MQAGKWRIIEIVCTQMNLSIKRERSLTQQVAACMCLLALLLSYAPMAMATLMAITHACCSGDACPIHGNHHPARNNPAESREKAPTDCGHQGQDMSNLSACSMSCCHEAEQNTLHAHIFLLTPLSAATALAPLSAALRASADSSVSLTLAPLAPPPKSPGVQVS
jgi:hypothetical protein